MKGSKKRRSALLHLPKLRRPKELCDVVTPAWSILEGTRDTVNELFTTVSDRVDAESNVEIRPSDQDLLRAAIVFTSAGIDASMRRLLRDAIPLALEHDEGANAKYKAWIHNLMKSTLPSDVRNAVASPTPREELIKIYIERIAGSSIQGQNDLVKVRAALGWEAPDTPDVRFEQLKEFFKSRNDIVHEMDYVLGADSGSSSRRERSAFDVRDGCKDALELIAQFLRGTNRRIRAYGE